VSQLFKQEVFVVYDQKNRMISDLDIGSVLMNICVVLFGYCEISLIPLLF
jgi:hypothetical protein